MLGRVDEVQFQPECPYCGAKRQQPTWAHPYTNREAIRCDGIGGCGKLFVVEHSVEIKKSLRVSVRKVEGE